MKRCDVLIHGDDGEPTRLHGQATHHMCLEPACPMNGRFAFSPMAAHAALALADKHGEIFVSLVQIGDAYEFHVTSKRTSLGDEPPTGHAPWCPTTVGQA